jgi:hypothetical protein
MRVTNHPGARGGERARKPPGARPRPVVCRSLAAAAALLGGTFDCCRKRAPNALMVMSIRSVAHARLTARRPDENQMWMSARVASQFHEPGWVQLEPPRDGAVLFIHPARRTRAVPEKKSL